MPKSKKAKAPKPRRSRARKPTPMQIERHAIEEGKRLAALLADAPAEGTEIAPPMFLTNELLLPALQFWKDHAPTLHKQGLLDPVHRRLFAMCAVYYAEWLQTTDDILRNGYSYMVKTISGDMMPRENPSVSRRAEATKHVLDFAKRFGLTPIDCYALFKVQKDSPYLGPLFDGMNDRSRQPAQSNADEEEQAVTPTPGETEWGGLLNPPPRPN